MHFTYRLIFNKMNSLISLKLPFTNKNSFVFVDLKGAF